MFDNNDEIDKEIDNEKEDWYDRTPDPEPETPVVKKPKVQPPRPDDPRYYAEEESEWEHLRPMPRKRLKLWILLCLTAAVALWLGFCYVFLPYVDMAEAYGYVESVERRGAVMQSYEGVIIPYKEIKDTTRLYDKDFTFTASDVHVAARLRRLQHSGKPVGVCYRRYHFAMPWRGRSTTIVDSVFVIDAARLLPPDRRPQVP